MHLPLFAALALLPQTPMTAPGGSLERAAIRVAPPSGSYPEYPNGGRVTQLGMHHAEGLETFGLFRPGPLPTSLPTERPLLVLFHSFGGDGDGELEAWTEFSDEADLRHWYILAPDQDVPDLGFSPTNSTLRRKTYGNDDAQERLSLTLRWVLNHYPIDRTRIYAVGFSMGGGDVLSYAAQHMNPAQGAFAAVATNAGTLCLTEEYWRNLGSSELHPAIERAVGGGSGPDSSNIFDFERYSSLHYVDLYGPSTLDLGRRHPVQNLAATPLQAWVDTRDPSTHLRLFVDDLEVVLGASQPGGLFERHDVTGTGDPHRWVTFDYAAVCDTFATKQLVVPKSAHLSVSRDARYWDLWLQRVDSRAFGEVRYDFTGVAVPGAVDRVRIVDCQNMRRVRFDGGLLGLGMTGAPYEIELHGNPDRAIRLELENVPQPSTVFRNNTDVTHAPANTWAYNAATQKLTLQSAGAATDLWSITNQ